MEPPQDTKAFEEPRIICRLHKELCGSCRLHNASNGISTSRPFERSRPPVEPSSCRSATPRPQSLSSSGNHGNVCPPKTPTAAQMDGRCCIVCGRRDLNPHALASATPSRWCVCHFATSASRDYKHSKMFEIRNRGRCVQWVQMLSGDNDLAHRCLFRGGRSYLHHVDARLHSSSVNVRAVPQCLTPTRL